MARLTDLAVLARYKQALADWKVEGAIELEGRAAEGLRTTVEGVTVRYFKEALYRYVCEEDGEIDQVKEERDPWRKFWEWHYDLRLTINGVKLYVETRLYPESFSSDKEPTIRVVQIKPV
jgi:hypothetical protein